MKPLPLLVCLLLFGTLLASPAAPLPPSLPSSLPNAVKEDDLDFGACKILRGSDSEPLDAQSVRSLLGIAPAPVAGGALKEGETVQYLLVFKQPLSIGTILGGEGELRILKAGAPLPINTANSSDWLAIETPRQSAPRFAPLPPGTMTRAVLVSAVVSRNNPMFLRLIVPRLLNHTPEAGRQRGFSVHHRALSQRSLHL